MELTHETLVDLKKKTQAVRHALRSRGVEDWVEDELDDLECSLHEVWEALQVGVQSARDNDAVRNWAVAQFMEENTVSHHQFVPGEVELMRERARQALLRQGAPVERPQDTPTRVEWRRPGVRGVVTEPPLGAPNTGETNQ